LHSGANGLRETSKTVTAELGALELAAAHAPPNYEPDPQRAPQITAGPYLHMVRAIHSSPADTPAQIGAADPVSRAAADSVLIALDAPTLLPLGRTKPSPLAPPPALVALTSGVQVQRGNCFDLTPLPKSVMVATVTLPNGGMAIRDQGSGVASAALKRFGETPVALAAPVRPRSQEVLVIPRDAAPVPWQLQLTSSSPLSVCGLVA
jgi:hypothetical protein